MDMSDDDLIGYCDIHCETPRALFFGEHVNRMLKLAGYPKQFVTRVPENEFFSLHEPMKELVRLARDRQSNRSV